MESIFLTLTHYSINDESYPWHIPSKHTGVGNMLFQIASCLAYAIKHNKQLCVPGLNSYLKYENLQKENTIFRNIDSTCHQVYVENMKNNVKLSLYEYIGENNREYILDIPPLNNMIFFGYFENWRNFNHIRNKILKCFGPSETDKNYILDKFPMIHNDHVCSVHIRMGRDYFAIPSLHAQLKDFENGYITCIDHMIQTKNITTFVVLTDNKDYCQTILDNNPKYKDLNIQFIYSNEKDFVDIWIISLIKNNIVSMSTLAWWGSFLNDNPDQYVICYKKNRPDLHYPRWIVVE